jgi:uncharacterized iron-regulated protein
VQRLPILLLAASFLLACNSQPSGDVSASLRGADIVILGEVHDNPTHHRNQAGLITALAPSAVAFEMLNPAQAEIVNRTDDRGDDLRQALGWDDSGWPDWSLYQPLFAALADTPVYGMALPGPEVNRAVSEGAAAVFGEGADRFGLTTPLPEAQQAEREAHQLAAHCDMLPAQLLPGMVQAQRLRDAAFSRTSLQALEDTGGPVVVITGSGHARRDWCMPAVLAVAAPAVTVASLGQLEAQPADGAPFDAWLVAEPAPREDPCAAFAAQRGAEMPE